MSCQTRWPFAGPLGGPVAWNAYLTLPEVSTRAGGDNDRDIPPSPWRSV